MIASKKKTTLGIKPISHKTSLTLADLHKFALKIQSAYRGYRSRMMLPQSRIYSLIDYKFTPFGNEPTAEVSQYYLHDKEYFDEDYRMTIIGTGYLLPLHNTLLAYKKKIDFGKSSVNGPKLIICDLSLHVLEFWKLLKTVAAKSLTWDAFYKNALEEDKAFERHTRRVKAEPFIVSFTRIFSFYNPEERYLELRQIISMASVFMLDWTSSELPEMLTPFLPVSRDRSALIAYTSNIYEFCKLDKRLVGEDLPGQLLRNIAQLNPDLSIHAVTSLSKVLRGELSPTNLIWSKNPDVRVMKEVLERPPIIEGYVEPVDAPKKRLAFYS